MKTKMVKDLMVPLSEYATVPVGATLADTVAALKKSQAEFDQTKYRHRAVLVFDENKDIVGKISMISLLRGLEPKYDDMLSDKSHMHLGFTRNFQKTMIEQLQLWEAPLTHICEKAMHIKVDALMESPGEGEYIEIDATLDEAIHQFILNRQQSLLVTKDEKVVGTLRLTDVFEVVTGAVTECEI
jgi:CBS domain-containing protein